MVPANATGVKYKWESANSEIVTVDTTGKITATGFGETEITVSYGSVTATVVVAVGLENIIVKPASITMLLGKVQQITATAVPEGEVPYIWESSNPGVATVDTTGKVTAVSVGTTEVTVSYGTIKRTVAVKIIDMSEYYKYPVALWMFDDPSDFSKASIGAPLEAVGNGFEAVNDGIRVATGSYYKAIHGIPGGHGGGSRVNEYSVLFDCKLTQLIGGVWYGLIQTDLNNNGDNDIWIDTNNGQIGCGDIQYSADNAVPIENTNYHRIVVTAKLPEYKIYVDGNPVLSVNSGIDNDRRSLHPDGVLLFADAFRWDTDIDVSTVSIWDRQLTEAEVKSLGTAE
jgi:hypothetical protein